MAALVLFVSVPMATKIAGGWGGIPRAIAWIEANGNAATPVYITDWGYCEGWINPELVGLRYYAFSADRVRLVPTRFPLDFGLRHPEQIPADQRVILGGHVGRDEIAAYLQGQRGAYELHDFQTMFLFDISPSQAAASGRARVSALVSTECDTQTGRTMSQSPAVD